MADTIRWGIAGPGRIAAGVADDLPLVEGAVLAAVGSRSRERAEAFAREHGTDATRVHGLRGPAVLLVHGTAAWSESRRELVPISSW